MKKEYISPIFEEDNVVVTDVVLSSGITSGKSDVEDFNIFFNKNQAISFRFWLRPLELLQEPIGAVQPRRIEEIPAHWWQGQNHALIDVLHHLVRDGLPAVHLDFP